MPPLAEQPTVPASPASPAAAPASPPAPAESLRRGDRVGEYEVVGSLGTGGMGEVYEGRHPLIGKRVAIKILRRSVAAAPEAAERFLREAQTASRLDHPGIVDTFGFGQLADGRLYLVMEHVDGATLRALLRDGPLALERVIDLLGQVADALDAAAARGVVHRDLKPDNVMVTRARPPRARILDFGIAKLLAGGDAAPAAGVATLTAEGAWVGTPAYMAPEQWSADGASPASDRYALAILAYELLAGRPPFAAPSAPAVMEQHFRAEVPPLPRDGRARGAARLPAAVDEVLRRALAKDPARRFETAAGFVAALAKAGGVPRPGVAAVAVAAATSASAEDAPATKARRPSAAAGTGAGKPTTAALAALVLVGTAAGGWALRGSRIAGPPGDGVAGAERPGARAADAPSAGVIDVASEPPDAEVRLDGALRGATPLRLELRPGWEGTVEVRRPGYLPAQARVGGGSMVRSLRLTLPRVTQFEGVWQLPGGALRALAREDDAVMVYKLAAVHGPREPFRRYPFTAAEGDHVRFATDEEHVDARAPQEPSCRVPLRVSYDYAPATDALVIHRERVEIGLRAGRCVVLARAPGAAEALVRIEPDSRGEGVWTTAPSSGTRLSKVTAPAQEPAPPEPAPKRPAPRKRAPPRAPKASSATPDAPAPSPAATTPTQGEAPSNEPAQRPTASTGALSPETQGPLALPPDPTNVGGQTTAPGPRRE